jgi:hypothetical protein
MNNIEIKPDDPKNNPGGGDPNNKA